MGHRRWSQRFEYDCRRFWVNVFYNTLDRRLTVICFTNSVMKDTEIDEENLNTYDEDITKTTLCVWPTTTATRIETWTRKTKSLIFDRVDRYGLDKRDVWTRVERIQMTSGQFDLHSFGSYDQVRWSVEDKAKWRNLRNNHIKSNDMSLSTRRRLEPTQASSKRVTTDAFDTGSRQ